MSLFDFLKRKPQSYAGPAYPSKDLSLEDVQKATAPIGTQASVQIAPSFSESKRSPAPQEIVGTKSVIKTFNDSLGSAPTSTQDTNIFNKKLSSEPKPFVKPDPFKDNFGELQGLIDEPTLASGDVGRISEAVLSAQRTIAEERYNPIDNKSSWFQRFWEPTKQAAITPGDTLITQAQNIANYGLEPLGLTSRPVTRKGQLEALDRFLEKYAPERLVESKVQRAIAGEQSAPQAAAEFTTNIGTTVVGSTAAISAFRALPIAAKLKAAGETGIYATHFLENLIAGAVASTPGSFGKKKAGDFHKLMITNGGFLFPTATYGGLAIATTASFLGNIAMGQKPWEAAGNSMLGLAGAAVQRKELLGELQGFRRGAFSDALRGLTAAQMDKNIPDPIKNAAIDEAAGLRAYHEQNPQDYDGLYKMTMDSQKKMIKLYGEYQKASPFGEQRLIGRSGPMQNGPDGGFPEKPNQPDMEALAKQYGGEENIPLNQVDAAESARVDTEAAAKPKWQKLKTAEGGELVTKNGDVYRSMSQAEFDDATVAGHFTPSAPEAPGLEGRKYFAADPESANTFGSLKENGVGGNDVLVRVKAETIPDVHTDPHPLGNDKLVTSVYTTQKLPTNGAEFSVDGGKTWALMTQPPVAAPATTALPSVFKDTSSIPVAPRLTPTGTPAASQPPVNASQPPAGKTPPAPTGESSSPYIVSKPLPVQDARRLAVDLYKDLDSEYNPPFINKANQGPEFASAEQNAGLAQELVTNPQIRGVLQQVTGKQGYDALEKVELDNLGPFVKSLRDRVENGTPSAQALDNVRARIRDDSNGEYGRMVLEQIIAKSRGEVKASPKRPNEEEILSIIDRAVQDGRLKMSDEVGDGRSLEQVYETLYEEVARKSEAARAGTQLPSTQKLEESGLASYARQKLAKNAKRRELLGDVLKRNDASQTLSSQQLNDARLEAGLTNKDLAAIHQQDNHFESALEQSRKLTQIEYNRTVAEAKQLPPEVSKKIIADLEKMKAEGKIASPLEARLQKNKFLGKLLTQQKGMTRTAQREAVKAKKDANNEKMKAAFKTLPRMPGNIQKMMKFLHTGYRKSMPLAQQEQIVSQMRQLNEIGAQQNRLFKEKRANADKELAAEVIKTAVRRVKKDNGRVRNRISPFLRKETPPNLVIMDMGEGAFRVFKDSMDEGMNKAWPMQRDWDRQVLEKAKELGMKYEDMKQIVLFSHWNRGGKAGETNQARLIRMGAVDPLNPPILDAKQQQFYDWQRKFLKELAGKTKEVFEKENPLRELDISDPNYFPAKIVGNDFTVSKGANTMSIDQVPDGFTKNIKGNEAMDLYIEPDALFRHINDVAHYVTLTEKMQQMRRILERPEIIASLGNENVDYLQNDWLDLVARHGTYAEKVNEAMAMLNAMGNRAYGGILAGKAIVGLRQFGSVIDAMGPLIKQFGIGPTATYIGKVIKYSPALIDEHLTKLGDYIETNPDLQASVGLTDLVMEQVKGGEFSSRHTFLERHTKLNKFIFAVIRQPDLLGRATLAMHVEGLYKAQGIAQPEAQRLAMQMVNNVFGSMRVHNRPTASGSANTRPLYLFGQTMRARQGMFRQAFRDLPKDPLGNSAILGSYMLSSMILMYLGTLIIGDDDSREKAQKQSVSWGWFYSALENTLPIVGPMISRTLQTGSASNAIPYLGMVMNSLSSYRQVVTGKKTETKVKGLTRGTEQALGAAGIPAPAIRSNFTLLINLYKSLTGGKTVESVMDPEVTKKIDQMKKDLQKELNNGDLENMKKDLRKQLQNVR